MHRLLILLTLLFHSAQAQNPLTPLEDRLMRGDKDALFDLVPYLDSKKQVVEFLGWHRLETTESSIAHRILYENSLFTTAELPLTDSTEKLSSEQFFLFLDAYRNQIFFSDLASAFLVTPLEAREAKLGARMLSLDRKKKLEEQAAGWLNAEWATESKINELVQARDSRCLLLIASGFFKTRSRFNRYYYNDEEYIGLLEHLLGMEIGTENEVGEMTWHLEKEYYPAVRRNLLVYFARNHSNYSWDEKKQVFSKPGEAPEAVTTERQLFELLNDKNETRAMEAFVRLTTCDPAAVQRLSSEYRDADIDANSALPIFPYNFLKQLVVFTAYCKKQGIDFNGTPVLLEKMRQLKSYGDESERYRLENEMIAYLTLETVTAFEYWALVNESSFALTHSAGRILDIFYSKNWEALVNDPKHLDAYLKKSKLFDELGIIGVCNNYLIKFHHAAPGIVEKLSAHNASDAEVDGQKKKALTMTNEIPLKRKKPEKDPEESTVIKVKDLEKKFHELVTQVKDSSETEFALAQLLSNIGYEQIGTALRLVEGARFPMKPWRKYSFIKDDWGFYNAGDFDRPEVRMAFLQQYEKLSEYELYAYYLDAGQIDYKKADGSLDHDKIYDLLKQDITTAFAGGGGGVDDHEVYSLVKLLELTFKTRLDFPEKFCRSAGAFSCDAGARALAWMQYLEEKKLLQRAHPEPVPFLYLRN